MKRFFILLAVSMMALPLMAAEGGFLFVTFKGEQSPMSEQIHFGLSKDGRNWRVLNGSEPVLVSNVGEKGVRDPYLLKTHDGRFVILATDLSQILLTQSTNRVIAVEALLEIGPAGDRPSQHRAQLQFPGHRVGQCRLSDTGIAGDQEGSTQK